MRQTTPEVHSFFDTPASAACYIVKDPASNAIAIINSILDFDAAEGRVHTTHADMLIDEVSKKGWQTVWILETSIHADRLSAAPYLAAKLGGKIASGANLAAGPKRCGRKLNAGTEFEMAISQFDRWFADRAVFEIGNLDVSVLYASGHAPACVPILSGMLHLLATHRSCRGARLLVLGALAGSQTMFPCHSCLLRFCLTPRACSCVRAIKPKHLTPSFAGKRRWPHKGLQIPLRGASCLKMALRHSKPKTTDN